MRVISSSSPSHARVSIHILSCCHGCLPPMLHVIAAVGLRVVVVVVTATVPRHCRYHFCPHRHHCCRAYPSPPPSFLSPSLALPSSSLFLVPSSSSSSTHLVPSSSLPRAPPWSVTGLTLASLLLSTTVVIVCIVIVSLSFPGQHDQAVPAMVYGMEMGGCWAVQYGCVWIEIGGCI